MARKDRSAVTPLRTLSFFRISAALSILLTVPVRANAQDDPKEILLHTKQRVLDTVTRLPRYVCIQTVDRSRYEPGNPELGTGSKRQRSCDDIIAEVRHTKFRRLLSSSDRLRLDVAVNLGSTGVESEMYSWAGENRFGDHDLFEFVHEGAVSTGSFSSILASIFGGDAARFSYTGDSTVAGRVLSEFGFNIPLERSKYMYVFGNGPGGQTPIAYDGSVFVDPKDS